MGNSKIMMIMILQTFIALMTLPCMAEEVSFRSKTAIPPKFKLKCEKILGKHDVFPTYKCPNKKGDDEDFDPGNDWEEVALKSVCYHHRTKPIFRVGLYIQSKQDKTEYNVCIKNNGDLILFVAEQDKWEMLDADHPDCKPHIIKMDVPRGTTYLKED